MTDRFQRNTQLFSNTPNGATASAILYSIVETAKANALVVHDYISKCLQHAASGDKDFTPLLPWDLKQG